MKIARRLPLPIFLVCLLIGTALTGTAFTQAIDDNVQQQINDLLQEKEGRTHAQRKMSSRLVYALKAARGERLGSTIDALPDAGAGLDVNDKGVLVDIRGTVSDSLENAITGAGGAVFHSSSRTGLHARVPLSQMENLAGRDDVAHIKPAAIALVNGGMRRPAMNPLATFLPRSLAFVISTGSVTSQGMISHGANTARTAFGVDGTGIKVGVLSDSAIYTDMLIGTGDLPANTVIVQNIDEVLNGGPGTSEGTAMMEIVHDMAPGAQLFFASAFNGEQSFADNIRTLRFVYHCDVIVDDVSYSDEAAFQDGIIAQGVNDVVADGAIYFSAAANSGSLTDNTSGTWEGDFNPGVASAAPLPTGYTLHNFSGQSFNRLTASAPALDLFWSDPLGGSANDYDLFLLNSAGTAIVASSTNIQDGNDDPVEEIFTGANLPANTRIVIAAKAGAATRAMHLDTNRGRLQFNTQGSTHGHNAAQNAVTVAAVYWNSAKTGTRPFVGGVKNPNEPFSSDGPRKIFYNADGTVITPGNLLFATNGGTTLVKPDIAAADGGMTRTPGGLFNPFFGTSAAAPHAAGIAALAKQLGPTVTNTQIYNAMISTALDSMAAGIDRDSGYGIVMAVPTLTAVPH